MTVQNITETALQSIQNTKSLQQLEDVRLEYLGRKGQLSSILQGIGKLPLAERKQVAMDANLAKSKLLEAFASKKKVLDELELEQKLEASKVDVTLPGQSFPVGGLHPVTKTIYEIEDIFASAGFVVAEGLEIEDDFHNFSALNIAENHPARAMHDTFYFDAGLVLRTHTSPVQIRELEKGNLPLKVIAPGRVYRCDSDQTHTPMFHQVEGLVIDNHSNFGDLHQVLTSFLKNFFDDEQLSVRFRPSYFPFTEPSAEVDIAAQHLDGDDWLEVLGCGMVHPNVLKNVGIDPQQWQGYAFGMGVERLAMLRHNVKDLRQFFINDLRFLEQFRTN